MRFTNGYWLTREGYTMKFATHPYRVTREGGALRALAFCNPVNSRRDATDNPGLSVRLSSPMENVIRVEVTHFAGACRQKRGFALETEPVTPVFSEDETGAALTSGALTARVSKADNAWKVSFSAGGRLLTESGYHAMAHAREDATGKTYMVDSLSLDVGEMIYGLGERFGPLVKNGQSLDSWNADGGTASEQTYKSVPFFLSNRGYGVLVDDPADVSFEIASEKVERAQFSVSGERLSYLVIYGGTPADTLSRYTRLTGRPALPPAWSFGLWLTTSFTPAYNEETVLSLVDGMAERGIPLSVFHFDCYWMKGGNWCDFTWDRDAFPDPEGLIRKLHARGVRVCLWINPYISQESPLFEEGVRKGYLLRKTNGDVWQTDFWQPGMAIPDMTNPDARAWYAGYLKRLLDMGVDCFKTDFGERIPVRDIALSDGSDPVANHNLFTVAYNRLVFELLEKERGRGEAVLFARSASVGGQQYPVHWGGDCDSTYPSMAETLRGGLSLALCGFGFWSHDISGFEKTATPDLYKRWLAFGLLSSHSRLHGADSFRAPWLFGEEACEVARFFAQLKCRLMPYLYGEAVRTHETGVPMMRPMMLAFPNDPACETLDRQYMLGENLLVAPVFRADGRVSYYLPDGAWVRLLTGETVHGGHWREETHGYLSLPLLVRKNSALLMSARDDRPEYDARDGLALHVFHLSEGREAVCRLVDTRGAQTAVFRARNDGGEVRVETDFKGVYSVVIHR